MPGHQDEELAPMIVVDEAFGVAIPYCRPCRVVGCCCCAPQLVWEGRATCLRG